MEYVLTCTIPQQRGDDSRDRITSRVNSPALPEHSLLGIPLKQGNQAYFYVLVLFLTTTTTTPSLPAYANVYSIIERNQSHCVTETSDDKNENMFHCGEMSSLHNLVFFVRGPCTTTIIIRMCGCLCGFHVNKYRRGLGW